MKLNIHDPFRLRRLLPLLCIGLLIALTGCQEKQTVPESLTVQYEDPAFRTVTYDEAVEQLAEQNGLSQAIGTQKLLLLQNAVEELEQLETETMQSGGTVSYFLLSQPISIPEAGIEGSAGALIVFADAMESDIYNSRQFLLIGTPVVTMGNTQYRWLPLDSSANLNYDRTQAKLLASGYLEALSAEPNQTPWSSETLYLDFSIQTTMIHHN